MAWAMYYFTKKAISYESKVMICKVRFVQLKADSNGGIGGESV